MQKWMDRWSQLTDSRWLQPVALGAVVAVAAAGWSGSATRGDEAPEESPGLRGILAEEAPDGLTFDDFAQLDGKWAEWSEDLATQVSSLYEEELTEAQQRELLEALRKKLGTMERALADDRFRSLHSPIRRLHTRLMRQVELSEALLDSLHLDPEQVRAEQVDAARGKLAAALKSAHKDLSSISGGSAWFGYYSEEELEQIAGGSELSEDDVQLLAASQSKLDRREGLSEEQLAFVQRDSLVAVSSAISRLHTAATRDVGSVDQAAVRAEMGNLIAALTTYQSESSVVSAAAARDSFRKLSGMLVDGGERLGDTLRKHYFNFNLHVVASESFINRFVAQDRTDKGPVVDFILGARVRGNQTTDTTVGVDLLSSASGARFDLTLTGVTRSRTSGTTPEAVIFTDGYHRFYAAKELRFDGDRFEVDPARIRVNANNRTTGARTNYSDVPLLGGLADNIAVGEARKRKGASEAIARSRVSDRVLPEFNAEVDKEFAELNGRLETELNGKLRDRGLFPQVRQIWTTDDQFTLSARMMGDVELGADRPQRRAARDGELLVQLHESVANNALDTMALAGETLSEEQLKQRLEDNLSDLLGREVKFGDEEASEDYEGTAKPAEEDEDDGPNTFVFDAHDPIRIQFRNGAVTLILKAAFKQEGKEDIPAQRVEVPVLLEVDGDILRLTSGRIRVSPVERPDSLQKQIAQAGVIRKKIDRATPVREVDTLIEIEEEGKPTVRMQLVDAQAEEGWLSLSFE